MSAAGNGYFSVSSGACSVQGSCIRSPNYPSNYDVNSDCTITVNQQLTLTTNEFETEADYDKLTIDGTDYDGNEGPNQVQVSSGDAISWNSDNSNTGSGWEVCGAAGGTNPSGDFSKW